ncbi:MAG: hypothetical protein HYV07_27330 [Deltaproteobacteria bacterium]|nr:hypothetical protein [Deltaproteobacteria bacterium]
MSRRPRAADLASRRKTGPRSTSFALRVGALLFLMSPACTTDPSSTNDAGVRADARAVVDATLGGVDSGVDVDSTPVPDASLRTAADYCEEISEFFCEFYLRCGRVMASSAAECRTYFLSACNERYEPRYVALESAGLLELSASGVAACRTHLAGVACEAQVRDLDGPCQAMWFGKSPAGAPCGLDVESFVCGPRTACVLGLDLCGECRPKSPVGGVCGNGSVCGSDATCLDGTCADRPGPGQACGADPPCEVGSRCESSVCVGPDYVPAGAACDQAQRCAYGSSCIGGVCVAGGEYGASCSGSRPCALGRCVGELCAPLAHEGEACATSLDCAEGPCSGGRCTSLPGVCLR